MHNPLEIPLTCELYKVDSHVEIILNELKEMNIIVYDYYIKYGDEVLFNSNLDEIDDSSYLYIDISLKDHLLFKLVK